MNAENPFRILAGALPGEPSFFDTDPVLHALLGRLLPGPTRDWLWPQLEAMGRAAAGPASEWSAVVDDKTPELKQFDRWGNRVNEIVHHPAYRWLEELAYGSGMVGMKYEPEMRAAHGGHLQTAGFALGFLFGQTECGVACPVCMTDGVARVVERHGSEELKGRLVPRLASRDLKTLYRGAMFLTEKQGGSDVGQNATRAERQPDGSWRLYGEKWFCSNVDGEAALVLARPDGAPEGTRGLGLFYLPRTLADGTQNARRIDRLKDKLGVRSMASGEVVLEGAYAELVGEPGQGFKQMADMLNLSRIWNAVCSAAITRRVVFETVNYLRARRTFGRFAIEHPLVRETLADVSAQDVGNKHLVFQLTRLLQRADDGHEEDARLLRILTPLAKYSTAKACVWAASEGIELLGGNGYIEDSPMPRLLRDAQVLPVWEGTTNIMILDTVRAISKDAAHEVLVADVRRRCAGAPEVVREEAQAVLAAVDAALADLAVIKAEGPERAAGILRRFTDRLVYAYEIALLLEDAASSPVAPQLRAAARRLARRHLRADLPVGADEIAALVDHVVV